MNYKQSITFLESYWKFGIKLGLHRINYLLDRLDNPQNKFKCVHIAGTNGKGSVCAMLSSILKLAGYKTAMFTSPHLIEYTERFKVNGLDISKQKLAGYISRISRIIGSKKYKGEQPTEFEILTAIAFLYFAEMKVDIAVIEVGLGGRYDSTNVITPILSLITNVDYDHVNILGNSLKKIAYEKAGIIKTKVPVITTETKQIPLRVVKRVAKAIKTDVSVLGDDYSSLKGCSLSLIGEHQKTNALLAVAAAKKLVTIGYDISVDDIKKGLKAAKWQGRFHVIRKTPTIIIDGAHNESGINKLVNASVHLIKKISYPIITAGYGEFKLPAYPQFF